MAYPVQRNTQTPSKPSPNNAGNYAANYNSNEEAIAGTFRAGMAPFGLMPYSADLSGFFSYPLIKTNRTTPIFGINTNYEVDVEGKATETLMAYDVVPEIAKAYKEAQLQQCTGIQEYALYNGLSTAYATATSPSKVSDMVHTTGVEAWRTGHWGDDTDFWCEFSKLLPLRLHLPLSSHSSPPLLTIRTDNSHGFSGRSSAESWIIRMLYENGSPVAAAINGGEADFQAYAQGVYPCQEMSAEKYKEAILGDDLLSHAVTIVGWGTAINVTTGAKQDVSLERASERLREHVLVQSYSTVTI